MGSASTGRGSGRGGKGRGRVKSCAKEDEERKPFDKSNVKYYNFQKLRHFLDEWHLLKKNRSRGDETENVAREDKEESSLLMAFFDEYSDVLFLRSEW